MELQRPEKGAEHHFAHQNGGMEEGLVYATCENRPFGGDSYTKKNNTESELDQHPDFFKKLDEKAAELGLISVDYQSPTEMADLMGRNMFKNIAEEFFKAESMQSDIGVEVTLFD